MFHNPEVYFQAFKSRGVQNIYNGQKINCLKNNISLIT
jgi:hypothetical protein